MNNILITGSTSYLGEYVVKNHTNKKFFSLKYKNIMKDVEVINDISELSGLNIDTLLHFANFRSGDIFLEKKKKFRKINTRGNTNIIYSNLWWN